MAECTFKPDIKSSLKRASRYMNNVSGAGPNEKQLQEAAIARLSSPQPSKSRAKLATIATAANQKGATMKRPITAVAPRN
jgi:hypothetical protein